MSCRVPLRLPEGWQVIVVDLRQLVEQFCSTSSSSPAQHKAVKSVQVCSSVLFRDIIFANKTYTSQKSLPKELGVKPQVELNVLLLDKMLTTSPLAASVTGKISGKAASEVNSQATLAHVATPSKDAVRFEEEGGSSPHSPLGEDSRPSPGRSRSMIELMCS